MANKLKIRRFPIDHMKPNRTILIVGKRGTGKSTLLKDILYHLRKRVDTGFAMSPTQDTIRMFEDCFPRSHIYNEYSLDVVRNMLNSLTSLTEQGKIREIAFTLDDCMFDKSIMKTKEMREIHMNGRHLGMWFINCVQYLMDLGPELRSQIDYVFILKENVISNRQKLHKYFFGIFEKYEEFSLVMDKCTNNHECLVLDNTQINNKIDECIFYYKADPKIGKFRLGKSIFFKLDHYFRRANKPHTLGRHGEPPKIKLPDPIQPKKRIQQVEKEEEDPKHQSDSKEHSSREPTHHSIHEPTHHSSKEYSSHEPTHHSSKEYSSHEPTHHSNRKHSDNNNNNSNNINSGNNYSSQLPSQFHPRRRMMTPFRPRRH